MHTRAQRELSFLKQDDLHIGKVYPLAKSFPQYFLKLNSGQTLHCLSISSLPFNFFSLDLNAVNQTFASIYYYLRATLTTSGNSAVK